MAIINDTNRKTARFIGFQDSVEAGVLYFYMTTVVVWLGVCFGQNFVSLCKQHPEARRVDYLDSFAAWDGAWYVRIIRDGYSYNAERHSNVAFFPVYPVLAGSLARITGLKAERALLVVSHLALIAAFVLAHAYVKSRELNTSSDSVDFVLLSMGLVPSTFFFRMAYTESLFLLLVILTLYSMQRNWPVWIIALIIGAGTGTRSVGIALLAPLGLHLWSHFGLRRGVIVRGLLLSPLALWGLLAFIGYQWTTFDEPLAFVKTQAHWNTPGVAPSTLMEKVGGLLTLKPIRAVYDENCPCYWGHVPPNENILFNLHFANPMFFLATVGIIAWGAVKQWLNSREWLLSAVLILIPYILHADRTCMTGEVRYSAVIFPIYLVIGRFLQLLPRSTAALLSSISAFLLGTYSALFVSWYWFY